MKEPEERIWPAPRHRRPERVERREDFELERIASCRGGEWRGRTKLDFGSSEPFDDLHGATAFRAAPKRGRVFGGGGVWLDMRRLGRTQQLKAKRQERGALAVGQEAEVTNAHETSGKDVQ